MWYHWYKSQTQHVTIFYSFTQSEHNAVLNQIIENRQVAARDSLTKKWNLLEFYCFWLVLISARLLLVSISLLSHLLDYNFDTFISTYLYFTAPSPDTKWVYFFQKSSFDWFILWQNQCIIQIAELVKLILMNVPIFFFNNFINWN